MAAIRFEVWWSDTARETLSCEPDQHVADVIEQLRERVGAALPEADSFGHSIEYGLYRDRQGRRVALQRRLPLSRADIWQDAQLYLADRKALWWHPSQTTRPPENLRSADSTSQAPKAIGSCSLLLSPGHSVDVPPEGLQLDRNYLFAKLPGPVVAWEKAKILIGRDSPLLRVSRDLHCKLFRGDAGWMLQAYRPTYIDGKRVQKDAVLIAQSATLLLGSNGWPIEILLESSTIKAQP